jgi:uncharacterized protein YyaL (SSP411 family)
MNALFWDPAGGWFSTTGTDPSVLLRMSEDYDGAEPSATSIGLQNLLLLGHLVDRSDHADRVERTLARYGDQLTRALRATPFMAAVLSMHHAGIQQVVIVGPRGRDDTRELMRVVSGRYLPFALVVPVEPGERQRALAKRLPLLAGMTMRDERATAYVCRNFTCLEPVTDAPALRAALGTSPARPAGLMQ